MSADAEHAHGSSARVYLIGFCASVVLTALPFWAVMTHAFANPLATSALVVVAAVAQILVHTICFLHVNPRAEGGWTLMAYAFTAVLVLICISGSLWIMHHLNTNMMPMAANAMGN